MQPFDQYPGDGQRLLPRLKGDNARRGYGLKLQQQTGQRVCAYCGVDLVSDYHHWLLLTVDHVIPAAEGLRLGMPVEMIHSYSNLVLCCSGCNGFGNRYAVKDVMPQDHWAVDEFFKLRNQVFVTRQALIKDRREEEMRTFNKGRWNDRVAVGPDDFQS